jgi:YtkA-like
VFLRRSSLVALCVSLAFLHGCRQQVVRLVDVNLTYEISPQPPRVGPTTIIFTLTDSGKLVSGGHITVEANMSHPGMIPVFADATEIEPGRYRAIVDLSMAGDWVVLADATLPTGRKMKLRFEINGVASS